MNAHGIRSVLGARMCSGTQLCKRWACAGLYKGQAFAGDRLQGVGLCRG